MKGIVVTGGGAQLKHVKQLFEYVTGLDTRIGLPTEHLANTNELEKLASPMYSTGIGLVLTGFNDLDRKGKLNETASVQSDKSAKQQSVKKRTGFFETLVEKGKNWFIEED
jgi:cell division protein FtsA